MADASLSELTRFTVALLAVLNPLAAIPIFLELTSGYSRAERARTARVTALTVGGFLVVAALVGESLLTAMGTSLAAFRVGGGIVVLMMAISMLMGRPGPVRQTEEEVRASVDKETIAVVPLGIPLLAGPGAISTVIIQMQRGEGAVAAGLVVAAITAVALVCGLVLHFAEPVGRFIGPIGLNVVVRLFGLLLAAIGVEFVVNGLKLLLPVLNG